MPKKLLFFIATTILTIFLLISCGKDEPKASSSSLVAANVFVTIPGNKIGK